MPQKSVLLKQLKMNPIYLNKFPFLNSNIATHIVPSTNQDLFCFERYPRFIGGLSLQESFIVPFIIISLANASKPITIFLNPCHNLQNYF